MGNAESARTQAEHFVNNEDDDSDSDDERESEEEEELGSEAFFSPPAHVGRIFSSDEDEDQLFFQAVAIGGSVSNSETADSDASFDKVGSDGEAGTFDLDRDALAEEQEEQEEEEEEEDDGASHSSIV